MSREPTEEEIQALRERSGSVTSVDPLVSFLYLLLQDHLPAGEVEGIMMECSSSETHFTNGWLAQYAQDLANRLRDDSSEVPPPG